ncbi:MAG: O-antigen ligase family protein [Anaerolineales bacterium]|nr:O-antigen ligase family protein [Anaerolineales bacterium]
MNLTNRDASESSAGRQSWQQKLAKIAWAFFLIALPVTSFPLFPGDVGGKTLVRPLSIYPLIILLALVTLPRFLKRPLPKTFLPLLAFIVVALVSSVVSFGSDLESLRGVTILSRFLRNIATLGIGVSFYFTVALMAESLDDLDSSLRWLYLGFGIALLWGTLQALYIVHYHPTYFEWLNRLQSLISTRKLFTARISGMTYEPKWFAEQISFVLLPWLLGSILTRRSLFSWRLRMKGKLAWVSVEWLLLVWSVVILLFTFSRTGIFILFGLTLLCFLLYRLYLQPRQKIEKPALEPSSAASRSSSTAGKKRKLLLEIGLLVSSMLVVLVVIGSQSAYFSRFWRYFTEARQRNRTYLDFIAVQQRFTYFETAYRIFETYPLVGVGLGNYAFYFDEMLPDQIYFQPEIIRQTTPEEGRDRLITPKNLIARLLSETGILGTAAFIAFILAILGCVLYLLAQPDLRFRYWGLSGLLAFVVFGVVVFSFDSFALPNMWVVFGLITAAAHLEK